MDGRMEMESYEEGWRAGRAAANLHLRGAVVSAGDDATRSALGIRASDSHSDCRLSPNMAQLRFAPVHVVRRAAVKVSVKTVTL